MEAEKPSPAEPDWTTSVGAVVNLEILAESAPPTWPYVERSVPKGMTAFCTLIGYMPLSTIGLVANVVVVAT